MRLRGLDNDKKFSLIKTIVCKYINRFTEHYNGMYYHNSYPHKDEKKGIVQIISESSHDYSPIVNKEVYDADDILLKYEKQIIDELKHHLNDFSCEDKEYFSSFLSDYERQKDEEIDNYEKVFFTLVNETKKYIIENNIKSMVLGISGGIDSTVVAVICHYVSLETGIPLIGRSLPIKNKDEEFEASKFIGKTFCTDFKVVNLSEPYNSMLSTIICNEEGLDTAEYLEYPMLEKSSEQQTPVANGNIQARLRMNYLYNLASIHKGIVFSTDNQTEFQLGFWTLHGDVGDFNPLFGLWKHEVYGLAKWLRNCFDLWDNPYTAKGSEDIWYEDARQAMAISARLLPTDGLGISNSDLEQIGATSYDDVDDILMSLVPVETNYTKKATIYKELIEKYGDKVVDGVWKRHTNSDFKRKNLPIVVERKLYDM